MAPQQRKASMQVEVTLATLRNCLVNLPVSLVSALDNANTVRKIGAFIFFEH